MGVYDALLYTKVQSIGTKMIGFVTDIDERTITVNYDNGSVTYPFPAAIGTACAGQRI